MQVSVLLAFLAMIGWGFGDYLIQRTTRRVGVIHTLAWIGLASSILLLPFVWNDLHLLLSVEVIVFILALGVITFVSAVFNFEALKQGKISVIEVVLLVELPITIFLSMIFFHDRLTAVQFGIIGCIMLGVLLISTSDFSIWKKSLEKGFFLAIFGGSLIGIINFMTSGASKNITPVLAIWAPWTVFTLISFAIIFMKRETSVFFAEVSNFRSLILGMCLIDIFAWIFFSFALQKGQTSIVTSITESYPIISIILGVWLNKESIKWHQYLGGALALMASILLTFTL